MTEPAERKNIAILFGGRSAEHEISVITALQAITALDVVRFRPIPVYIDLNGRWYSGDALLERSFYQKLPDTLSMVEEVTILPTPGIGGLSVFQGDGKTRTITKTIPIDVALCAFHGQFGEDGCIQGLLELADIPYTGCGVLASAIAMNKYLCKSILSSHGVPVLPGALATKEEVMQNLSAARSRITATPGLEKFPLFIKPCNLGSSIGIGVAKDQNELDGCLARVFRYDSQAIIEPCVTNMFEINISVAGGSAPFASVVEIPVSSSGALTYEDKYLRGGGSKKTGQSQGMASLTRKIDPPDLDDRYKSAVTEYALTAYRVLGCRGVVRFDFMVDLDTGKISFNELNPLPGSLSFYLWVKSRPQMLYTEELTLMIEEAERTFQIKNSLERNTGFKALKRQG